MLEAAPGEGGEGCVQARGFFFVEGEDEDEGGCGGGFGFGVFGVGEERSEVFEEAGAGRKC